MESGVDLDRFKEENRALTKAIQNLILKYQRPGSKRPPVGVCFKDPVYLSEGRNFYLINNAEDYESVGPWSIPEGLSYPMVIIDETSVKTKPKMIATPNGFIPNHFLGPNGDLYEAVERYILSTDGQAIKLCYLDNVTEFEHESGDPDKDTQEIVAERYTPDYGPLPQMDKLPSDDASGKSMALEPGDYEKIRYMLEQIQSGRWVHKHTFL